METGRVAKPFVAIERRGKSRGLLRSRATSPSVRTSTHSDAWPRLSLARALVLRAFLPNLRSEHSLGALVELVVKGFSSFFKEKFGAMPQSWSENRQEHRACADLQFFSRH